MKMSWALVAGTNMSTLKLTKHLYLIMFQNLAVILLSCITAIIVLQNCHRSPKTRQFFRSAFGEIPDLGLPRIN